MGADALVAVLGVLYCALWVRQIQDFKALNDAKFDVLNAMAPYIKFGETENSLVSSQPFAVEWEKLKERKTAVEQSSQKIIALQSSGIEYAIPKAFQIIYLLILSLCIVFSAADWDIASRSLFQLRKAPETSASPIQPSTH